MKNWGSMEEHELIEKFEACTLPPKLFHHEGHVRVAWIYLSLNPLPEAMMKFRDGLKAFAKAQGVEAIYNETISFAFLILMHDRLRRSANITWEGFKAENGDLLDWKSNPLKAWYGEEELKSALAKKFFVLPAKLNI